MQRGLVTERRHRLQPHHPPRRLRQRPQRIRRRIHRPHLERPRRNRPLQQGRRQVLDRSRELLLRLQRLGCRCLRHLVLMLESLLLDLKRRRQIEDRMSVLRRDHPPCRERAAIANPIDRVHDRPPHIPRPQKIRMQRMHVSLRRHRLHRRRQCLPEHLPAEHRAPPEILTLTAKQVLLELLECEQRHQLVQNIRHGRYSKRELASMVTRGSACRTGAGLGLQNR